MSSQIVVNDSVSIDLHSTGVGTSESTSDLALGPSVIDPYWTVQLGPAGFPTVQARVLIGKLQPPNDGDGDDNPHPYIWINANGTGAVADATYIFRNVIDLSNFDPTGLTLEFTLSSFGASAFAVAANGQLIYRVDPPDAKPRDVTVTVDRLKRGLNTIDVLVRLDVRLDPIESKVAGLAVRYRPKKWPYSPPVAVTRPLTPGVISGAGRSNAVLAKVPRSTTGRSFQDLAVPLVLPPPVHPGSPEPAAITVQMVTLADSEDGSDQFQLPQGPQQVYGLNIDPPASLSARVMGRSHDGKHVYLRIWLHQTVGGPLLLDSTRNVASAITANAFNTTFPDEPTPWPSSAGVVVVVTNTGDGPGGGLPT